MPLYRASKREREGPIAKQWEGEGSASEHHAGGEAPSPQPSPPFGGEGEKSWVRGKNLARGEVLAPLYSVGAGSAFLTAFDIIIMMLE